MSRQGPPQHPPPTADEIDAAVSDVFLQDSALSDNIGQFQARHQEGFSFFSWLGGLWDDLTEGMFDLQVNSPVLFWVLFAVLCLILVLLLAHIGWTLHGTITALRAPTRPDEENGQERRRRHTELLEDARRLAEAGQARDAVRLLVLSLLALLDERHVLRFATSWTTREILDRLAAKIGDPTLVADFGYDVERASYSSLSPDLDTFRQIETEMLALARITEEPAL